MSSRAFGWWALGACLVLFGAGLGGYAFLTPDEPRFGLIASEMLASGHWVVPRYQGEIYSNKPPLFLWLVGLMSLPLGRVTEWSARLPSVLAATGTVLLTWRMGRRLAGETTGRLAAAILAATPFFFNRARWVSTDMTLTLFFTLALASALWALPATGGVRSGRARLFFVAAGLATLAKGPVGLALPGAILVASLIAAGRWRDLLRWPWVSGGLLYLAVVAPWYVAYGMGAGGERAGTVLLTENVTRFLSAWNNRQPPTYYLHRFPLSTLPWSVLFPAAGVALWRRRRDLGLPLILALCWLGVTFVFFTISSGKRTVYMLPAFPATALIVAWALTAGWPVLGEGGRRWARACGLALALLLGLAAVAGPVLVPRAVPEPGWLAPSALAVILAGTAVLVALAGWRGRARRLGWALAGGTMASALAAVLLVMPLLDSRHNVLALTRAVRERMPPACRFATGNQKRDALLFYSGLEGPEIRTPAALEAFLGQPGPALALVEEPLWRSFEAGGGAGGQVLLRMPVSDYHYVLVGNSEAAAGG